MEYLFDRKPRWNGWTQEIRSYDMFAQPVPQFNFEGRNKVGSNCGLMATLFFHTGHVDVY